jgi:hypothetical protein
MIRGAQFDRIRVGHLPEAGRPYRAIGFGQAVHDYSTVHFPAPVMKCEVSHEQDTNAANDGLPSSLLSVLQLGIHN